MKAYNLGKVKIIFLRPYNQHMFSLMLNVSKMQNFQAVYGNNPVYYFVLFTLFVSQFCVPML